jgi:hypothetical protein
VSPMRQHEAASRGLSRLRVVQEPRRDRRQLIAETIE